MATMVLFIAGNNATWPNSPGVSEPRCLDNDDDQCYYCY